MTDKDKYLLIVPKLVKTPNQAIVKSIFVYE